MKYHVLIETKEKVGKAKKNKQIFELDIPNKTQVITEIVKPYINKHEFQFDGYFLSESDIVRIVVKESEQDSSTLSNIRNSKIPPNVIMFVTREDVIQDDNYTTDITKEIFKEAKEISATKVETDINETNTNGSKEVFVVHGHDNLAKLEVSSFIKDLGYTPIILHEQASGGATIIEKIEEYTNVGFGVVLYTPCDKGGKNEDSISLLPRARQNVVFEHGYLIGKLKRGNVCALVKGDVETPNDISGVVYVDLDEHGAWKIQLAKEMRKAGYEIDMNDVI